MAKRLYSFMLNDEVVRAADAEALGLNTFNQPCCTLTGKVRVLGEILKVSAAGGRTLNVDTET